MWKHVIVGNFRSASFIDLFKCVFWSSNSFLNMINCERSLFLYLNLRKRIASVLVQALSWFNQLVKQGNNRSACIKYQVTGRYKLYAVGNNILSPLHATIPCSFHFFSSFFRSNVAKQQRIYCWQTIINEKCFKYYLKKKDKVKLRTACNMTITWKNQFYLLYCLLYYSCQ